MKILIKGKNPEKLERERRLWWLSKVIECSNCQCKFELEESDKPKIIGVEYVGSLMIFASLPCPNCNEKVEYKDVPKNNPEVREEAVAWNDKHNKDRI
jgi:DNA-directed RNA polymerase subunit RPC12/RpoP